MCACATSRASTRAATATSRSTGPTINSGSGFDVNPNTNLALPPLLNTRQDRTQPVAAPARGLGVLADVSESIKAGVRLATGSDDSPVSTNQTLGGGLAKKGVWLDQGWLSYKPVDWVNVTGGPLRQPVHVDATRCSRTT